jgi:hypothetical protein
MTNFSLSANFDDNQQGSHRRTYPIPNTHSHWEPDNWAVVYWAADYWAVDYWAVDNWAVDNWAVAGQLGGAD